MLTSCTFCFHRFIQGSVLGILVPEMLLQVILCSVAVIYVTADVTTDMPNRCPQPTDSATPPPYFLYGHPNNCSYFFTCSNGRAILMECSPGTVWSDFFQTCVGFNSHFDTCTRDNAQRECERQNGRALLIPHPTACQRYYNCSKTTPPEMFSYLSKFEDECPYSDVFDVTNKTCKSFKVAYCGPIRVAAKNPCDYFKNRCGSHCEPCPSRLPSCEGLANGIHEHPLKLWSPYFILCDTERLVEVRTCGSHPLTERPALFSPVKQACVSLWEIPRENGGLAPTCDGKLPGQYQTVERPDVYFQCPEAEVSYCGVGFVFNESSGQCEIAN